MFTIDAFGDEANAGIFKVEKTSINTVKKYKNFNAGRIWKYITLLLGMRPQENEFKIRQSLR